MLCCTFPFTHLHILYTALYIPYSTSSFSGYCTAHFSICANPFCSLYCTFPTQHCLILYYASCLMLCLTTPFKSHPIISPMKTMPLFCCSMLHFPFLEEGNPNYDLAHRPTTFRKCPCVYIDNYLPAFIQAEFQRKKYDLSNFVTKSLRI